MLACRHCLGRPARLALRWWAAALFCAGIWPSAHADIYKYVDERGVIHVTNVRPTDRSSGAGLRPTGRSVPVSRPRTGTSGAALPGRYDAIVEEMARSHQIDAALIHALIRAESNYNASAVSPKGAIGLMQLMPATARRYEVADPRDATQNIRGGVRYLRDLLDLFHHDLALTLAAYNAGEAAVARYGGVPPYPETTSYVAKVLEFYLRPSFDQILDLASVGPR
jgi:soluble lytic murein transglycosylase-like protein